VEAAEEAKARTDDAAVGEEELECAVGEAEGRRRWEQGEQSQCITMRVEGAEGWGGERKEQRGAR
jgi:hypothetical protein